MGEDAGAAIIYGFPFAGEGCYDSDFDDGLFQEDKGEWLAQFQDLPKPEGDHETNEQGWQKYWNTQMSLPITTEYEGHRDSGSTTTYLCIRASMISGSWDYGTKIPIGHIKPPPPEWDAMLKKFCEKAGVKFVQPEWYMIASYG